MNPGRSAIIFDMDGVLTDSEPLINAAAIAMFKEKGLEVRPADFLPFVGTGEDRYIGGVAELHRFPIDIPEAKRRTYEIYLSLVPERLEAFPGAVELVRSCRAAGLKIAVASSADRIKIDANLRKIGLPPEQWNAIVSGEDVQVKKPAPDIFLAAAAKLGVTAAECVVVEDAVNGVQAAKAAGMRCVAVAQTFKAEELAQADLVCERISDLTIDRLVGNDPPTISPAMSAIDSSRPPWEEAGPWGFWATVGFMLGLAAVMLVVQVVVVFVWAVAQAARGGHPTAKEALSNGLLISLMTIAQAPVAIGLICLLVRLRKGFPIREYLALRRVRIRQLLLWSAALVAMAAGSDLLAMALHRDVVPEFMRDVYRTSKIPALLWLAVVVAAPVYEEVVFRGFVFKSLLHSRLGAAGAIVVTAGVWASIHFQYDAFGVGMVFVAGLLLGLARLKTGSLYTTIYLHALMNLLASLEVVWL